MRRPLPPLFLHQPGRFAQVTRTPARVILLIALLIAIALAGATGPSPDLGRQAGFYTGLADSLRHGDGAYYAAATSALRGSELPVAATGFPAPAGARVAALPPLLRDTLLAGLTTAIVLAWFDRFRRAGGRFNLVAPLVMVTSIGLLRAGMAMMPPMWAGLLLTLALGLWRPDRWLEPVALALAAAIVTPAALPVLPVMAVAAWHDRRRAELIGWTTALVLAAAILSLHLIAAADAAGFDADGQAWQPAGPLVVLRTLAAATGLSILPDGLALVLTALAAIGWMTWQSPLASRALATTFGVLLLAALLPAERSAEVLVVSPLLWFGLIPAIEALRDLAAAALDTRRITVTRVVR